MLTHSGFYFHILRELFIINQIYVVSRYMHCATCHNEQFFYYVMMGLTCHKPHKGHGSLLNRVPLMYVCLFKKIRRKCISPLDSNKKRLCFKFICKKYHDCSSPKKVYSSRVWRFLLYHMNIFEGGRYCSAKVLWPSD